MKQIVLQSLTRNQHARKQALWFVSLLLVLVIGAAAWLTAVMLDAARERQLADLDYTMISQAQGRTTSLTVWYGGLRSRIDQIADSDLLRLFATEVAQGDVAAIQKLSDQTLKAVHAAQNTQKDQTGAIQPREQAGTIATEPADDSSADSSALSGEQNEQALLAAQLPLMRSLLANFVYTGFTEGMLVTDTGVPYLSACELGSLNSAPERQNTPHEHVFTPEMEAATRATLESGTSGVFPLPEQSGQPLQLLLTQPLYAPGYMASKENKPIGVLLLGYDLTPVVRAVNTGRGLGYSGEGGRLLVAMNGTLYEAKSGGTSSRLVPLPDWKPVQDGLPLELRALPGEGEVWSRGLKVPDLPWFVVQDEDAATLDAQYRSQRGMILLGSGAACVIAILLVGMIWWWLIGRQERAVSDELKDLYHTVNQQHEFLRGINGTLDEGICLFDREGKLQYANDAFAAMFNSTPEALLDKPRAEIFGRNLLERLQPHDMQVLHSNEPHLFTEVLPLPVGRRNCQVACSPFRDEEGKAVGIVSAYRDITELVQANERAQAMVHQTINVLVRAIEAVDPYLRGQSMHTGLLAAELARGMRLAPTHAATVRAAANLSHIGMIQLPRELITKAGTLTPDERVQLEHHVDYARASLEGIDFGLPVIEAITQMHERLDGSGYPRGLAGDQISIDARLLAVANTFCALMRPRSYRTARSVKDSLLLLSSSPSRYDPRVVQTLFNFLASPAGAAFVTVLCQAEHTEGIDSGIPTA